MPHRFHDTLVRTTTLMTVAVLSAGILGAAWWLHARQCDPATLDRDELFRWLVTCDLSDVSPQTRWLVAKRLDEEFSGDVDWSEFDGQMSAEHCDRLWANIPLILEPWFMDRVNRYHQCDDSRRMAMLDTVIDKLVLWRGLESITPAGDSSNRPSGDLKVLLLKQIDVWRKHAKPQQQERIDELVAAIEVRWLFRQLAGTLNAPGSTSTRK